MKRSFLPPAVLTASLVAALTLPAFAAPEPYQVEVVQTSSVSISWYVNQEFGEATLRVTGPKHYDFSRTFEESAEARFKIYDGSEDPRDGTYRWSLSYKSPVSGSLQKAIDEARENGDVCFVDELKETGEFAAGSWSGTFLLVNGKMIVPQEGDNGEKSLDNDLGVAAKALPAVPGFVDGNALPAKDQVILDDLIVDGSACIGFDCVNGESFSFDTIRLKENNLRIKFDDTSVAGSYPRNDWELVANDSANGGASKFTIRDTSGGRDVFTVEASAPNNSLYVDDGGRVGLGTAVPVVELHVVDGDTPTLRLAQDTSSGFEAQTWDVAGNETSFFVRDTTSGSTLPFRIRPGAASNTLVVDTDSQVGVGLLSPDTKLHVKENGTVDLLRIAGKFENNGPVSLQLFNGSNSDSWVFSNKTTGFEISKGGTGVNEFILDGSGNLTINGGLTTAMGNYPDYVFEAGYELMPLDELASFIAQNGHLPNVKSESEVAYGKRVDISELSRSLLEKVEELTLYTLEQHDTDRELRRADDALLQVIDKQNELIRQLEARISALESGN